jgi:ribose transport system permease protein
MEAATQSAPPRPSASRRSWVPSRDEVLQKYGVIIALLALIIFFSLMRPHTFPTSANLENILNQTAVLIVLSAGLTVVLALGDFDLSIAAVASIAGVLAGITMVRWGLPVWLSIVGVIGVGCFIGLINGLFVAKVRVSAFIATLAMGSIVTGFGAGANQGALVQNLPKGFSQIARGSVGPISNLIVISLGTAAIIWFLLEKTVAGRQMAAIGESEEAARLAGVRVVALRIGGFVLTGGLAAAAGLLLSAQSGTSSPDAASGLLLPAYAAAFLGASTLKPGEFHIVGTVIGVLLASVTVTGMTMIELPFWLDGVVQGSILLIAISLARSNK